MSVSYLRMMTIAWTLRSILEGEHEPEAAYAVYERIQSSVIEGTALTDLRVVCAYQTYEPAVLLTDINTKVTQLEFFVKDLLKAVKVGYVHETLYGRVDSDANDLDLEELMDIGSRLIK